MFRYIKIQAGIPKSRTDDNSQEQGIIASLTLTGGEHAIAVDPVGGYVPKLAQSKQGIWSDSQHIDGRILQGQNDQNVTEEMVGYLTASTVGELGLAMGDVSRMQALLRDFWQTNVQIEPVYLHIWYLDAPGPQYALLYNMDVTEEINRDDMLMRQLTFTIEREPFWRPIPPGSNPRLWTLYKKDRKLGREATIAELDLTDYSSALLSDIELDSRCEWDSTDYDSFLSNNWLDIPKENIDGDAPALGFVSIANPADQGGVQGEIGMVVWGIQQGVIDLEARQAMTGRVATTFPNFAIFNGGDSEPGSMTKTIDACGVISNGQNVNAYVLTETLAQGVNTACSWDGWTNTAGETLPFTINQFKGQWMAYIRGAQTNGAAGDTTVFLRASYGIADFDTPTNDMPLRDSPTVCIDKEGLLYLGVIDIVQPTDAWQGSDGLGLWVQDDALPAAGVTFEIHFENLNASTRDLEFVDLILIPLTNAGVIDTDPNFSVNNTDRLTYNADSTGYLSRGKPDTVAYLWNAETVTLDVNFLIEYRGSGTHLLPGVDHRLYFIDEGDSARADRDAAPVRDREVAIDILPRWRGMRDV